MIQLEKNNIHRPLNFSIFWHLIRPHTLTAAFIPVFIGTMYAFHTTNIFRFDLFFVFLLACLIIQAATNVFNEYYDFKRGLDTEEAVGIGGTIVRENVAPLTVRNSGFILFGFAMLLGVYLCIQTTWLLAVVGSVSMLVGYLYTGGPKPIAYTPFGEWFAGFFMGTVIINIAFFLQTQTVTMTSIIISFPIAVLIAAILLANNIRDFDNDKDKGRQTLAIMVGKKGSRNVLKLFFIAAFVSIALFIIFDIFSYWALVVVCSIPFAKKAIQGFENKKTPKEMMPAMALTAKTNTVFGLLLCLSFVLNIIFN